jgi:hypothetical protein
MPRTPTLVQLNDELLARLDERAAIELDDQDGMSQRCATSLGAALASRLMAAGRPAGA